MRPGVNGVRGAAMHVWRAMTRPAGVLAAGLALTLFAASAPALSAASAPALSLMAAGTKRMAAAPTTAHGATSVVDVVAAENEYGDVVAQIGGRHVHVTSIINDPTTDPHSYESSTADAAAVARAQLIIVNGLGYDAFMQKLEDASPRQGRVVIDVGHVFGRKAGDNPHQWYDPATMPRIGALVAAQLAKDDPADAAAFQADLRAFDAALGAYTRVIAQVKRRFAGTVVAVTEPVFGYALAAAGLTVLTPRSFQLAIQEGNDPAPQDVQTEKDLLSRHKAKLFVYNQQAIAPITASLLPLARAQHIPIVGVYETKPRSMSYQQWMVAEMSAVQKALATGASTETLR